MKYKIEFYVECSDATPKQLRKFLKYLNFDSTIINDIVTYPNQIKITEIKNKITMDYEKLYKEALERAKKELKECGSPDWYSAKQICRIFPELHESEDERIRKEIISIVKSYRESCITEGNHRFDDCIAWLEKQGEQKPTDKVEPKFKVGDWIVCNGFHPALIVNIDDNKYEIEFTDDGASGFHPIDLIDRHYHLWTIEDAKDGDVLLFEGYYNSIVLFQGIGINGKGRINYHCKCDLGNYSFGIQGDVACLGTIEKDAEHYHPTTKEQHDLLFQKMSKAGYTWNEETKQLIKKQSC